jgi:thioredoxin 1
MYKSFSELGEKPQQNTDLYNVVEIQNMEHKRHILGSNRLVCVDIYANWCQPCKLTEGDYSVIASEFESQGLCAIVKENYEKKLTNDPAPTGLPTYQFFLDGQKIGEDIVGADLNKVRKTVETYLNTIKNSGGRGGNQRQGNNQGNAQPRQSEPSSYYSKSSIRNNRN